MANPAAPSKIRIGIAGLGMAGSATVPSIAAHPAFKIVGAAEPNDTLRQRFSSDFACETHVTIEAMVGRGDVDAVYIATPHQFHREHTVVAAQAGKHVLVEKPMALTVDDCDAMIRACDQSGVRLIVGHTHSFDPSVLAMRKVIESGRLGRVSMIMMFDYTNFLYRPRRPEELDTSLGGGIIFNQVPHQVDIARFLVGDDVASVFASANMLDPRRPTEGGVMAMLQFRDGASASLVYSGYDRFDSDELFGWIGEGGQPKQPSHGRARAALKDRAADVDESRLRVDLFGYGGQARRRPDSASVTSHPHFGIVIVSCEHGDLRQTADGLTIYADDGVEDVNLPSPRPGGGRAEVLDEFSEAVLTGRETRHSGRFARGTVESCLAILESSRKRSQVAVAAKTRETAVAAS